VSDIYNTFNWKVNIILKVNYRLSILERLVNIYASNYFFLYTFYFYFVFFSNFMLINIIVFKNEYFYFRFVLTYGVLILLDSISIFFSVWSSCLHHLFIPLLPEQVSLVFYCMHFLLFLCFFNHTWTYCNQLDCKFAKDKQACAFINWLPCLIAFIFSWSSLSTIDNDSCFLNQLY